MTQQLLDYINQDRTAGQSDEQIKDALLKAGWPENVVVEALIGKITVPPVNSRSGSES